MFLGIRHAVMKISGNETEEGIESILDQNEGIFEYFKNFYNTALNVFKFSLQKPSGISEEMEKNILFAMMEWLQYQKVEKVFYPVMHSNLISKLFPVEICPNLDISQTDCFIKDENKEKMVPLDWTPSMRLSAWSDMVAHVGPAGSGKQVRAAG